MALTARRGLGRACSVGDPWRKTKGPRWAGTFERVVEAEEREPRHPVSRDGGGEIGHAFGLVPGVLKIASPKTSAR